MEILLGKGAARQVREPLVEIGFRVRIRPGIPPREIRHFQLIKRIAQGESILPWGAFWYGTIESTNGVSLGENAHDNFRMIRITLELQCVQACVKNGVPT